MTNTALSVKAEQIAQNVTFRDEEHKKFFLTYLPKCRYGDVYHTALVYKNKRLELLNHVENLEQYETIILGFPNWWADLPMPVYTFLEEYDFGAKTIIPFVTHGGSGFSRTLDIISELQPGAHVSENTLSLSRNSVAGSEEDVVSWAESLEVNAKETMPENSGDTVANAEADPVNQQILYL